MKKSSSKKKTKAKAAAKIVRMELNEHSRGKTDWARVSAKRDADIVIDEETPELAEDFWKQAKPFVPPAPKRQVSVRLDSDVLEWFRAQGDGFTTHINAVLKSYMHAKRKI